MQIHNFEICLRFGQHHLALVELSWGGLRLNAALYIKV